MTRSEIVTDLMKAVSQAEQMAVRAYESVADSTQCTSALPWWVIVPDLPWVPYEYLPGGDPSACQAMVGNASRLKTRVQDLGTRVAAFAADPEWTQHKLQALQNYVEALVSEARLLVSESEIWTWREFVMDVFRRAGAYIADMAIELAGLAGQAAGGFLLGMGPVGLLLVGVAIYAAVRGRFG